MDQDKIIIFVRKTQDWSKPDLPLAFDVGRQVAAWNKRFRISYFEFRRQIKEIAMETWKLVTPQVFHGCFADLMVANDQVVVPTDDDDWFGPQLRDRLLALNDGMLCWQALSHHTYKRHGVYTRHRGLGSNEYAITGTMLKKLANPERFLHAHGRAHSLASGFGTIQKTDEILSCYNWHPGSASALYNTNPALIDEIVPPVLRDKFPKVENQFPWVTEPLRKFCDVIRLLQNSHIKML